MKGVLPALLLCVLFASLTAGQSSDGPKAPPPPTAPPAGNGGSTTPAAAAPASSDAPVTAPAPTGDPNCLDKFDQCKRYDVDNCIGIYEGWAKENCARYCGYCMHPNDTKAQVCVDKLDNCNEYQSDMCTNATYRIFVDENCAKYCNACDFRPRYIIALENAPSTTPSPAPTQPSGNCRDKVDYCWNEPDRNCFGIYEPWARDNCPFRCGFCPEKPKCEDEILFCAQFTKSVCTDDTYQGWARKNCRKWCNMCALPSRPADQITAAPGTGIGTGPTIAPTSDSSQKNPSLPGNANGNLTSPSVVPPGSNTFPPGSNKQFLGQKSTIVIQGDQSPIPGTCFYKGEVRPLDVNWSDGCDYICNCFDAARNRVICTERCTQWNPLPAELAGSCSLVKEPGDCCQKLECNA